MQEKKLFRQVLLLILSLALVAPAPNARGQQQPTLPATSTQAGPQKTQPSQKPQPSPQNQADEPDDLLRVETELVQTAVSVVDKKAQFVEGLRREQFEMRIDGKPQPISFFERVDMGSSRERQQLAAARGELLAAIEPVTYDPAMTVFLFVDDLRLDSSSFFSVKRSLLHYIDNVMGENTQAAIASTSGQIGFLQQLTDDKAVLRAAVARLGFRSAGRDQARPTISVYQAFAVQEQDDFAVKEYLIKETMRDHNTDVDPMLRAVALREADADVTSRTRAIVEREGSSNKTTFSTLERLLRNSAQLPGRKLIFFFSAGFMLQARNGDDRERMSRITDAAARAHAIVYTVDARGLATDPLFKASGEGGVDLFGRSTSSSMGMGEIAASQQALLTLAGDTGGRAILNTNAVDAGINRALDESSRYYLLAWRPEMEANRGGKFRRMEVSVVGRPDLTVRLHRGYYSPSSQIVAKIMKTSVVATPQAELNAAVAAAYPRRDLPALLVLYHVASGETGGTLAAAVGVSSEWLTFKEADGGRSVAAVDLACVVVDDNGKKLQNFSSRLDVSTRATIAEGGVARRDVMQDFQFKDLKPGLYQVRAGVRDAASGRIGGVARWFEIPDLSKGEFTLGSVVIGESTPGADSRAVFAPVKLSGGRPLTRGARLHFSTYLYNAMRALGQLPPSVTVRAVVVAGSRVLGDTGECDVPTEGFDDLSRLPYTDAISLQGLPIGRYLLQVTATDRGSGKSVSKMSKFSVE